MKEVDRAIAQIGDIRAQIAASTRFRGYAPEALVVVSVVSLLVTLAQSYWPSTLAHDNAVQVIVWGMVLLGSFASIALEAGSRARSKHGEMGPAMLRGALRTLLPITFVAALVAGGVALYLPAGLWIVPAVWLLLIALAAFSSLPTLPHGIVWPAMWYLAAGTALIFLAGPEGRLTPWMMGVPMVVGHLMIAWVLRPEGWGLRHG